MALLALTAVVSVLTLYPTQHESGVNRTSRVPLVVGDWFGRDLAVGEDVKRILETDDVIQRNYVNPVLSPVPVQLAVVFSADNRRVAHPPEVCYKAAGWEVNHKSTIEPQGLSPMIRLILADGGERELVLYCYKAGPELTANYLRQQFNLMTNQLFTGATSSVLIRLSTMIHKSEQTATDRVLAFARRMMPELAAELD